MRTLKCLLLGCKFLHYDYYPKENWVVPFDLIECERCGLNEFGETQAVNRAECLSWPMFHTMNSIVSGAMQDRVDLK